MQQPIRSGVTGKNRNQKPISECKPDPKVLKGITDAHTQTKLIVARQNGAVMRKDPTAF